MKVQVRETTNFSLRIQFKMFEIWPEYQLIHLDWEQTYYKGSQEQPADSYLNKTTGNNKNKTLVRVSAEQCMLIFKKEVLLGFFAFKIFREKTGKHCYLFLVLKITEIISKPDSTNKSRELWIFHLLSICILNPLMFSLPISI